MLCKKIEDRKEFGLANQMKDSSGSVMDNIPEGFIRGGNKEFIHFLYISRGSGGELKSQVYRAFDQNLINNDEYEKALQLTDEIINLVTGLINYLQASGNKGYKYS